MQSPQCIELRRQLVPRLRKYFLHPDRGVRADAMYSCTVLGCLSLDDAPLLLKKYDHESVQVSQSGWLHRAPAGQLTAACWQANVGALRRTARCPRLFASVQP